MSCCRTVCCPGFLICSCGSLLLSVASLLIGYAAGISCRRQTSESWRIVSVSLLGHEWMVLLNIYASQELGLILVQLQMVGVQRVERTATQHSPPKAPKSTAARTPLGEFAALPKPRNWWGGERGYLSPPKNPIPCLGPSSLAPSSPQS